MSLQSNNFFSERNPRTAPEKFSATSRIQGKRRLGHARTGTFAQAPSQSMAVLKGIGAEPTYFLPPQTAGLLIQIPAVENSNGPRTQREQRLSRDEGGRRDQHMHSASARGLGGAFSTSIFDQRALSSQTRNLHGAEH